MRDLDTDFTLGNCSNDYQLITKKKKTWLKGSVNFFSINYRSINANEILDIHKYLMKELFFK